MVSMAVWYITSISQTEGAPVLNTVLFQFLRRLFHTRFTIGLMSRFENMLHHYVFMRAALVKSDVTSVAVAYLPHDLAQVSVQRHLGVRVHA